MLLYCANGEKAFAPAGPAATMPRVHVPAASPAVAPAHQMPQEFVTPMQPVVEERSSTSAATPSQREMELTEALVVDAELGLASRTVAPVMLANVSAKDNVWGLPVQRSAG